MLAAGTMLMAIATSVVANRKNKPRRVAATQVSGHYVGASEPDYVDGSGSRSAPAVL